MAGPALEEPERQSPPTRTRPANLREQILDVAEPRFARRGFGATTLQAIASQAEIRVASLYNHFTSKDDLCAAVLERALTPLRELLDRSLSPEALERAPEGMMVAFADAYAAHPAIVHLFQHAMLLGSDHMHPLMRDRLVHPSSAGRSHLRHLYVDPDRFDEESIPLLQLAMFNFVCGYFTAAPLHQLLTGRDPRSESALSQQRAFLRRDEQALMNVPSPRSHELDKEAD
jgi:AcrR family transcriptional regulator